MLRRLGIEIRKIGDTKALYRDVDDVLSANNIGPGEITASIQVDAAAHSIQKMFNGNHFSICTIQDCANLCGLVIQRERMMVYQAIHCVNWNEMLPEFRKKIVAMIMDDFRPVFGIEESELQVIPC